MQMNVDNAKILHLFNLWSKMEQDFLYLKMTLLKESVKKGDTSKMIFYVSSLTGDTNLTIDKYGSVIMIYVILYAPTSKSRFEMVEILLKLGATPNYINNKNGMTPLRASVNIEDPHVMKLLIDNGAECV